VFSFLLALDMILESAKLIGPEPLYLVEPGLKINERFGAQAVHTKPCILVDPLLFDFDQATGPEYPQMPAHRRATRRDSGSQFTNSPGTFSQQFHYLTPGWISQRA